MIIEKNIKKKDLVTFLLIWATIFLIITIHSFFYEDKLKYWPIFISSFLIILSIIKPQLIKVIYVFWIKIGDFMGSVISKVILLLMFFLLFTPISIILKVLGRDLLRKKIKKEDITYWIERETQPQSMKNQF